MAKKGKLALLRCQLSPMLPVVSLGVIQLLAAVAVTDALKSNQYILLKEAPQIFFGQGEVEGYLHEFGIGVPHYIFDPAGFGFQNLFRSQVQRKIQRFVIVVEEGNAEQAVAPFLVEASLYLFVNNAEGDSAFCVYFNQGFIRFTGAYFFKNRLIPLGHTDKVVDALFVPRPHLIVMPPFAPRPQARVEAAIRNKLGTCEQFRIVLVIAHGRGKYKYQIHNLIIA